MSASRALNAELAAVVASLRAAAPSLAVLSDVDGTLAPIVDRPEDAAVPERARAALRTLADRCEIVACVSGRRAIDARRMVGLDELLYIGNHGFEVLEPGADAPTSNPVIAGRERLAANFVATVEYERLEMLGIRIEDKGPIQALHWRGAPSEAAAEMGVREVAALAQGSGLIVHWGRKVLELRPVAGIDKGSAIHSLLRGRSLRGAVYAGDDRTDLDAFRALQRLAAAGQVATTVCVGVGSDEAPAEIAEIADLVVDGTQGVIDLLEMLAGD